MDCPGQEDEGEPRARVPLCGRALEILDGARTLVKGTSPYLFPNRLGKQLEEKQLRRMLGKHGIAAVPHGFRSSFGTGRPRKRIIPARSSKRPSHMWSRTGSRQHIGRTDLFDRRRRLMDDWAAYLAGESRQPEAAASR